MDKRKMNKSNLGITVSVSFYHACFEYIEPNLPDELRVFDNAVVLTRKGLIIQVIKNIY